MKHIIVNDKIYAVIDDEDFKLFSSRFLISQKHRNSIEAMLQFPRQYGVHAVLLDSCLWSSDKRRLLPKWVRDYVRDGIIALDVQVERAYVV